MMPLNGYFPVGYFAGGCFPAGYFPIGAGSVGGSGGTSGLLTIVSVAAYGDQIRRGGGKA